MAAGLIKKTHGFEKSSGIATFPKNFVKGFVTNTHASNNATVNFSDGTTFTLEPDEVIEFNFSPEGYEQITVTVGSASVKGYYIM